MTNIQEEMKYGQEDLKASFKDKVKNMKGQIYTGFDKTREIQKTPRMKWKNKWKDWRI